MTNKLQQYFPMIRTREEVLNEIESKSRLKNLFYEWTEENQNEFLESFCCNNHIKDGLLRPHLILRISS